MLFERALVYGCVLRAYANPSEPVADIRTWIIGRAGGTALSKEGDDCVAVFIVCFWLHA